MSLEFAARVSERRLDAAFTVGDGETVALLGPNGAGKSTILSIIAGLITPDDGRVCLADRDLTRIERGRRTMVAPHLREIALLAQDPLLFPHLTALENVAFAPRCRRTPRRQARAMAKHWLEEVGVSELANRKPREVSGGQAQRIALARALAADPKLLLLDEPMAALDVAVTPALRQTLKAVLHERSVLIVTHDVLDALLLADRVVVIEAGRIAEQGSTAEVLTSPRSGFAARLAGLNLMAGRWRGGAVQGASGLSISGEVDTPISDGDAAVAVFRPSAVSVFPEAPGGSPRNSFRVTITSIEPYGDRIRVRAGDLGADITPRAATDLDLTPGAEVTFTVKATEVAIFPN